MKCIKCIECAVISLVVVLLLWLFIMIANAEEQVNLWDEPNKGTTSEQLDQINRFQEQQQSSYDDRMAENRNRNTAQPVRIER